MYGQWAIGDWLNDGKRHYGDGLYKQAAEMLGMEDATLRNFASLADRFELSLRRDNLSYGHHKEVQGIKTIETSADGKLYLSDVAFKLRESDKRKWTQKTVAAALGVAQNTVSVWFTSNINDDKASKPDGDWIGCRWFVVSKAEIVFSKRHCRT